ncbi:MAG: hypothetical protein LBI69_04335 [Puniceicoccales bacterium]|jgi:hypothetical protein|nr:hypothetical protein [Puniceicoccales bacterium]
MNEDMAVKIFKGLYAYNEEKAIGGFNCMLMRSVNTNRAITIFLNLYESDGGKDDALNILCGKNILCKAMMNYFPIGRLLTNPSINENKAVEIFKNLRINNEGKAIGALNSMLVAEFASIDRPMEIFLNLCENDKDDALDILCNEKLTCLALGKLLAHHSIDEAKAMEIFKNLRANNEGKAIGTLGRMAYYNLIRAGKMFVKMAKNCEEAAKILLREEITHEKAAFFLADTAISAEKKAEILTAACSLNTGTEMERKNRVMCILNSMHSYNGLREKITEALLQMDQCNTDSLLSVNIANFPMQEVRTKVRQARILQANLHMEEAMKCYEKEFISNFHHLLENTNEIKNQSAGWLGRISTEAVSKVLAVALAVIASSVLALWAIILWPLATCIGAGGAAVALTIAIFFRDRSANEKKSPETASAMAPYG